MHPKDITGSSTTPGEKNHDLKMPLIGPVVPLRDLISDSICVHTPPRTKSGEQNTPNEGKEGTIHPDRTHCKTIPKYRQVFNDYGGG